MTTPFEIPMPDSVLDRTHAFARELAYGVALGSWPPALLMREVWNDAFNAAHTTELWKHVYPRWQTQANFPPYHMLMAYGYVTLDMSLGQGLGQIVLTEKAFGLLERPAGPASVFISYSRRFSSALALLIEARLKLAGNPNPFLDKNMAAGDLWRSRLEDSISKSRYFVVLIAPGTLDSRHVLDEIEWAERYGCTIISFWHGGASLDFTTPEILSRFNALQVKEESAIGYETEIIRLLNSLGYATY